MLQWGHPIYRIRERDDLKVDSRRVHIGDADCSEIQQLSFYGFYKLLP